MSEDSGNFNEMIVGKAPVNNNNKKNSNMDPVDDLDFDYDDLDDLKPK